MEGYWPVLAVFGTIGGLIGLMYWLMDRSIRKSLHRADTVPEHLRLQMVEVLQMALKRSAGTK